jgi:hypothetical protein
MKALRGLVGEEGLVIVYDGIRSVEFPGGIIRFPCKTRTERVTFNVNGVRRSLIKKTPDNGYYSIQPEKLLYKERLLDDPGRYRLNIEPPTFSNDYMEYCTELQREDLLELAAVAKKAEYAGAPVMFAGTRAYYGQHQAVHRWNLGRHVGFDGEKLHNVVQHLLAAFVNFKSTTYKKGVMWRVFRTKEDAYYTGAIEPQYVFIHKQAQNPWDNCVVMEADYADD